MKIKKCECFQSRLIVPTTFLGKGDDRCFPDPHRLCHGALPENAKWLPLMLHIDTMHLDFKGHFNVAGFVAFLLNSEIITT